MTRWWVHLTFPLWLLVVGAGWAGLNGYAFRPGIVHAAPETWPEDVKIPHTPRLASLVLFFHPECPCSRATVAELARLLSSHPHPVRVTACIAQLKDGSLESSLCRSLRRIPGVEVVADVEGNLAKRFGAETSGTTALYDADGRLLFFGGITGARGHEGENSAKDALMGLLEGNLNSTTARPNVYGCSIF